MEENLASATSTATQTECPIHTWLQQHPQDSRGDAPYIHDFSNIHSTTEGMFHTYIAVSTSTAQQMGYPIHTEDQVTIGW